MTIEFNCTGCQYPFKVPDSMAGKQGKCPKCSTVMSIPAAGAGSAIATQPAGAPASDFDDRGRNDFDDRAPQHRKSNKGLIIGLAVAGVVLLGGVGAAVWFLMGGGLGDEVKFFPANTNLVVSIRVDEFLNSSVWKDVKKELGDKVDQEMKEMEADTGLSADKIDRVIVAGSVSALKFEPITIVKTKVAVKGADLVAAIKKTKYTESKIGNYTVFQSESGRGAFCVVDSKTIVVSRKEQLEEILKRDKKPELSADMKAALGNAKLSKTLAVAVNVKGLIPKELLEGAGGQGQNFKVFAKVTAITGFIDVGSDVTYNVTAAFEDSKSAEEAKNVVVGLKSLGKMFAPKELAEAADFIDKIEVTNKGSSVIATLTVKGSQITDLVKKAAAKQR